MQNQIIIILHGWGHSSKIWQDTILKLKQLEYKIICEDLPGFGSRQNQAINFGIDDYANWFLEQYKDILESQKIILIGHSLGGRIGLELVKTNPKWLSKLILIGTPGIYEPSTKTKLLKKLSFLKSIPGIKNLANNINPEYESAKLNNLKETYQNVVQHNQKQVLNQIQTPTLLIWGDQDYTVPVAIANQMKIDILNSELVVLKGQGHSPQIDNSNLLFGVIKNYLSKV